MPTTAAPSEIVAQYDDDPLRVVAHRDRDPIAVTHAVPFAQQMGERAHLGTDVRVGVCSSSYTMYVRSP
jgi:hypothetical protein